MASIFQLFGEIYVDNEKANAGIDETTNKGKEAEGKLGGAFTGIGKAAGAVGKAIGTAALAMGAAAVSGAAVLGREAFNAADEIQRLADVTGFSAEQIQIMQYQGKALGVDLETMTGAQAKLTKAMDAAITSYEKQFQYSVDSAAAVQDLVDKHASYDDILKQLAKTTDLPIAKQKELARQLKDGKIKAEDILDAFQKGLPDISAQAKAFEALGISVSDSSGNLRDAKEVMAEAMDKLAGVANETERDALAMQIFGKSAMELNPLIKAGSDGLADLAQQAKDTGAVMSNEGVAGMDNFGDRVDGLKQSLVSMAGSVLSTAMPSLEKLLDLFVQNLPMIQGLIEKVIPIVVQLMEVLLPPVMDLVNTLLPFLMDIIAQLMPFIQTAITALLPVIIQLIDMFLPPFMQIVKALLPLLLKLIEPLLPLLAPILRLLQPLIDLLMLIIDPLVELLDLILPPIVALITTIIKTILPPLQWAVEQVAKALGGAFKGAFEGLRPVIDAFRTYLGGLIDFISGVFSGNWGKAWEGVKSMFKGIMDGLVAAVKFPINLIIDGLNKFIAGINKIDIPDWVPVVGGKGFNLPTIPRLKVGMDYVPADDYPALLHKGERVLTAAENKQYTGASAGLTINIGTFINSREQDVQQFAEELEFYRLRKAYAGGG
jgi:hypothetical protein